MPETLEQTIQRHQQQRSTPAKPVTPHVTRLQDMIVNSYLVGEPSSGTWAVIDAGMSARHAKRIIRASEERFGAGSVPTAILLTHAHFDHVGSLETLLEHWNVPVYAHPLELPYLTGTSDYPPPDPTVGGGLMARMSPLFSRKGINITGNVQVLPDNHSVPGLPGWRWLFTPGHTPGHVSFFRDRDKVLIAGDAFVTVKNESAFAVLTQKQQVSRPPAYFTTDWRAARKSVEVLAALQPEIAATGHGVPMRGDALRRELAWLASNFRVSMPGRGRYVREPAMADERGVMYVPPPVEDTFPKTAGVVALAFLAGMIYGSVKRGRRKQV
jgi:glyoxylase-like metal-dependent hydrolase (beta-lactamase superfamily II)